MFPIGKSADFPPLHHKFVKNSAYSPLTFLSPHGTLKTEFETQFYFYKGVPIWPLPVTKPVKNKLFSTISSPVRQRIPLLHRLSPNCTPQVTRSPRRLCTAAWSVWKTKAYCANTSSMRQAPPAGSISKNLQTVP